MLTIHHLATSQSERIVWLCEELGVPYELIRYERDPATRLAPPEYKALHPFGTAPVITDGPFTLGESNAIVEYLLARHGDGGLALAPDHPNFADYLYWLHFANGSFVPSSMSEHMLQMFGLGDDPRAGLLRARSQLAALISEDRLGKAAYFAGETFTAADVMMALSLRGLRDRSALPNTRAYLARIGERPAYRRALAKAEPGLAQPIG